MTRGLPVNFSRVFRWIAYVFVGLIVAYVALGAVVLSAMLAPPERFGQFMKHMPEPDNGVERAYTGWPDRLYVIDRDGRIAYKSAAGPFGFKPAEVEASLKGLFPNN